MQLNNQKEEQKLNLKHRRHHNQHKHIAKSRKYYQKSNEFLQEIFSQKEKKYKEYKKDIENFEKEEYEEYLETLYPKK